MEEWSVWRHSSRDVWLDLGYHLRSGLDLHAYELLIQNLGQDQKGLSARVKWNLRVKPWNWKALVPWKKSYDKSRQHIKKQRHHFADKSLYSQSYGFSSSHVYMWELDCKESWAPKNWCFWTVVLERILESPLDCKEIQPVHPKGDHWKGVHWKDWCWSWNSNTLATWCEELTHLKRPWCWERLRLGGEGDDRGWDGWLASLT